MGEHSKRALRKQRRRVENDAYARAARFWLRPKSADRMGYDKPINRQAAKDIASHGRRQWLMHRV
jgi:hypothetical protein